MKLQIQFENQIKNIDKIVIDVSKSQIKLDELFNSSTKSVFWGTVGSSGMSHFSFLKTEFPVVHEAAVQAEKIATSDPRGTAFYARRALELGVKWAFLHDNSLRPPYVNNISALINEPTFTKTAGASIQTKCRLIISLGNKAVHGDQIIRTDEAIRSLEELCHFTYWLARTYAKSGTPIPPNFNPKTLPKPSGKLIKMAVEQLRTFKNNYQKKTLRIISSCQTISG